MTFDLQMLPAELQYTVYKLWSSEAAKCSVRHGHHAGLMGGVVYTLADWQTWHGHDSSPNRADMRLKLYTVAPITRKLILTSISV